MRKSGKAKEPIRVGIVGLGRAGWSMHCRELKSRSDRFTIVAAADVDAARCETVAEAYRCKTYSSLNALLKDPEVELVSIATLSPDHTAHAIQALKAGKRVSLEKPIALTYRDARRLLAASRAHPGQLFLRHNRRFEAAFRQVREIMDAGLLGDVYEIKLRRHSYQRRDDWQTLVSCGGGQLNNWGPHIVDHALRFLDAPVADVWADLKRVAAVGDAEDHLKIILRGRNGRVVDLEISGGAALSEPEYFVMGTRGALVGGESSLKLRYLDPSVKLLPRKPISASPPMTGSFGSPDKLTWVESEITPAPNGGGDMDSIWDHVYSAIRERKRFPITIEEAVEVVRITELARKRAGVSGPLKAFGNRGGGNG